MSWQILLFLSQPINKPMNHLVFFMRGYNDLDAFAPVAYKALTTGRSSKVTFVNQDCFRSYEADYRLTFLRSVGDVGYIDVISGSGFEDQFSFFEASLKRVASFRIASGILHRVFLPRLQRLQKQAYELFDLNNIPALDEDAHFVFDTYRGHLIPKAYAFAKERGLPVTIIPHGVTPPSSAEMPIEDLEGDGRIKPDLQLVNNENSRQRYASAIQPLIRLTGAPRYTFEWEEILNRVTPALPEMPETGTELKVVVFLSKWKPRVWKDETLYLVKKLAGLPGVKLVIKPHTRGMDFEESIPGATIVGDEHHSHRLVEWADVVVCSMTSIMLDVVLADKPLVLLRYVHAWELAGARFLEQCHVDSRAQFIAAINRLVEDRSCRTYSPEEREDCLDYYVGDKAGKVLEHTLDAMSELTSR